MSKQAKVKRIEWWIGIDGDKPDMGPHLLEKLPEMIQAIYDELGYETPIEVQEVKVFVEV